MKHVKQTSPVQGYDMKNKIQTDMKSVKQT